MTPKIVFCSNETCPLTCERKQAFTKYARMEFYVPILEGKVYSCTHYLPKESPIKAKYAHRKDHTVLYDAHGLYVVKTPSEYIIGDTEYRCTTDTPPELTEEKIREFVEDYKNEFFETSGY